MNISHLSSLPIGHAVELTVTVPPEFVAWHVRRRHDDLFPPDALDLADCVLIHAEECEPCDRITYRPLLDAADVQHGIPYYYQACGYNGTDWIASPTRTITPNIRARDRTVDPLTLLRDRLIFGLGDAVSAGVIDRNNIIIRQVRADFGLSGDQREFGIDLAFQRRVAIGVGRRSDREPRLVGDEVRFSRQQPAGGFRCFQLRPRPTFDLQ